MKLIKRLLILAVVGMGAAPYIGAQTITIHKADNTVDTYAANQIDGLVFSASTQEAEPVDATEFENAYYYTRSEGWFGRNFWEGMWLCTDEAVGVCFNADWYDNGRFVKASLHDFQPDLAGSGLIWDVINGINAANEIIAKYSDPQNPGLAPLRAIRAYYHFWMMEAYGDVPILDSVDAVVAQQPRADVAAFIESELLAAIPNLTEENSEATYGRPNKWMAEALLAKLYLNWGVYTNDITEVNGDTENPKLDDCIYWCNELINSGVFSLGNGYRSKFFPDNGVQVTDFIYAVPFDAVELDFGANKYSAAHSMMRFCDYRKGSFCNPYLWGWEPQTNRAGLYIITPEAVDRFCLEGDERNEIIAVGPQTAWDENFNITDEPVMVYTTTRFRTLYTNEELGIDGQLNFLKEFDWLDINSLDVGSGDDLGMCMKGARCFKYPANAIDDTIAPSNYIGQSNDIPIFRLADIMLMKAECLLRKGDEAGAVELVNQVRACASAPFATSLTLDELLDERSRELIMEPWRRNDLIRFGKFENCAAWKVEASPATMSDVNKRVFPFPTDFLGQYENMMQNPGY